MTKLTMVFEEKDYGADLAENETCRCWLKYRDKYEEKLAHQIGLMVLGEGFSAWRRGRKKEVGYRCTASECVEIYALYSFYRACWLKDLDHFYIAFIGFIANIIHLILFLKCSHMVS